MASAHAQLTLAARGRHGGYRPGAGRKAKRPHERQGHHPRPELARRYPVHVTLRVVDDVPSLRKGGAFRTLKRAFVDGKERFGFRLVHFSVQRDHLHFICEADDERALSRGMQGLAIRMAKRLNAHWRRRGKVFAARYRERILRTPTEVRNAVRYVLQNARHHIAEREASTGAGASADTPGEALPVRSPRAPSTRRHDRQQPSRGWIDPCSSAPWFSGWVRRPLEPWLRPEGAAPVVPARTWLLGEGLRRLPRLETDDLPSTRRSRRHQAR